MTMTALAQHQWIRILLALLTGACGTLAFSPYHFWPAALLSLGGLLTVTLQRTSYQATLLGFVWGLGLFGSGIHWVYISIEQFGGVSTPVSISLVVLLAAYLALYPTLFAGLLNRWWPQADFWRFAVAAPALWQVTEFLRARIFTGFPWLQFGYSQIDGPLRGIAPLGGVDLITYLLVVISGLLVLSGVSRRLFPGLLALILLFACWPLHYVHWYQSLPQKAVNIAMVQGNIKQSLKWDPNKLFTSLQDYMEATTPYLDKGSIIIWPESAIADTEANEQDFLTELDGLLRAHHSSLITGLVVEEPYLHDVHAYNSVIVLGDEQPYHYPATQRYNKHHLVPFGEFVPLEVLLRPLAPLFNLPMSAFSSGTYFQPQLKVQGYNFTTSICYEIILGEQVRANFHPDTDFLLTVSNDAWFGNSIGPWQHVQMARMRALELGRPLLRATNNGITTAVDASGAVIAELPQFVRQVLKVDMVPTRGETPYAVVGSIPLWILTAFMGISALVYALRRRH